MSNSYEIQQLNELINANVLQVTDPYVVGELELAKAHQDMWDNKHRSAKYVFNHALPMLGLKTKDELYHAWAISQKKEND